MSILRPLRRKDRNKDKYWLDYCNWLHNFPCLVCDLHGLQQTTPTEAAHIGGNFAAKAHNSQAVPLCTLHHRGGPHSQESLKDEFGPHWGLNLEAHIAELNSRFQVECT